MKITIKFVSRDEVVWSGDSWDDYMYDGTNFIVLKNKSWVGIYPMKHILAVEVQ